MLSDNNKKCTKFNVVNTNARSIGPKKNSLIDCMEEQDITLALVTETWLQTGELLEQELRDVADEHNLGVITENRPTMAANGRQYGGVALVFDKRNASFKKYDIVNPEQYEVLACVGTVKGVKGKIFCLTCYMPPNLLAQRAADNIDYLVDLIAEAKRDFKDCTLVLGGDFNGWRAERVAEEHGDLTEVIHGPTRAGRAIDRTFVNYARSIDESGTLGPLEDETGGKSDHKIAYTYAIFRSEKPKTITYTYRYFSRRGATNFQRGIANQNWGGVLREETSTGKAEALSALLQGAMDVFFPFKTTTRKETDPPWINWAVRSSVKKRRKSSLPLLLTLPPH